MTATWTSNRTWTSGELITASIMNQYIRDNLDWLKTPIAVNDLSSSIATTSASLVDVTGASVTFTNVGGGFDVYWTGVFNCTSAGAGINISINVDGATERTFAFTAKVAAYISNCSFVYHVAALSATSHTFKIQTSTTAGTVTITGYQLYVKESGA